MKDERFKLLELFNVEVKYYGIIFALRGISLQVAKEREIICLLGANGAGKSTLLKAISGTLWSEHGAITKGSVNWNGKDITHFSADERVRGGIAHVMEGHRVFEHLTVEENIKIGGHLVDNEKVGIAFEYFPILRNRKQGIAGYLSGGEQQMLVIARSLLAQPKLILLDEPSLGLAPTVSREVFNIIKKISNELAVSILLVEQKAQMALDLASYGYVLENGRVVLDGPRDKLVDNQDIREFYLGLTEVGEQKRYSQVKHYRRRKRWLG